MADRKKETKKEDIERYSFSAFCHANEIYQADLARMLGIDKQQINNWKRSQISYLVEHNKTTGDVKIIRAEKVVKSCVMEVVKA